MSMFFFNIRKRITFILKKKKKNFTGNPGREKARVEISPNG